jgi:hypothetical protein
VYEYMCVRQIAMNALHVFFSHNLIIDGNGNIDGLNQIPFTHASLYCHSSF